MSKTPQGGCIIPTLKYQDARAAITFLCQAFGFKAHAVYPGERGRIEHAELVLGNGMIMLGSEREGEFDKHQKTVERAGGVNTQSPYIVVDDVRAHHAQAVAAGAEVVMPPDSEGFGPGTGYVCKDPEGHLWSFGDYDPWKPQAG